MIDLVLSTLAETLSAEIAKDAWKKFRASWGRGARDAAKTFPFLRDFYAEHAKLVEGAKVTLEGTFSTFGPFLPGDPGAKRDLHLKIRRYMPRIEDLLAERRHDVTSTTIDSLMAFSAGQLVLRRRLDPDREAFRYFGLYESIVRNGVPLFVEAGYFEEHVRPKLAEGESATLRARVTGRVDRFAGYWEEILERLGLQDAFDLQSELSRLSTPVALRVRGGDDGTVVEIGEPAPYLDGDVWVAAQTARGQRVVSRFLDLSSSDDLRTTRDALRDDCIELMPGCRVISQFDSVDPLFPGPII